MKTLFISIAALTLVALTPLPSIAGESDMCKGCHNGSVAPSIDTLKSKFKTAEELIAGAKNAKNDMMKPVQANEAKLKAAAEEIMK